MGYSLLNDADSSAQQVTAGVPHVVTSSPDSKRSLDLKQRFYYLSYSPLSSFVGQLYLIPGEKIQSPLTCELSAVGIRPFKIQLLLKYFQPSHVHH